MTNISPPTMNPSEAPSSPARRVQLWRSGLIAMGVATTVNLLLFAASSIAEVSFLIRLSGAVDPSAVTVAHVVLMTMIPFVIGLAVAAVLLGRTRHDLRTVAMVGAGIALLSLAGPLTVETDTAAIVILAAMHLVTGVAFVVALRRSREA